MNIKKIIGWLTIILFPIVLSMVIFILDGKPLNHGIIVGVCMDICVLFIFCLANFIRWCFDL